MAFIRDDYELIISIESKLNSIKKLSEEGYMFPSSDLEKVAKLKEELESVEEKISQIKNDSKLNDFQFNEYVKYKRELEEVKEKLAAAVNAGVGNNSNQSYVENLTKQAELESKINALESISGFNTNTYADYSEQIEDLNSINATLYNISASNNKIIRENREWNEQISNIKHGYNEFIGGLQKSFNIIKNTTDFWRKQDEELTKMVSTFGLTSSEFEKYRAASYKTGIDMAKSYNKTQVDMVKMQQGYAEMTGKNIVLTKENYDSQFQLSQLMGDENSLAFTSGIEQFGVGIDDAKDKLYDIYKLNVKNGVSWSKTSKDLINNLKLAQKYNFKGGLDNMMEMTVWANKMKINLQTIGNIADKISSPEGVIETASKLQVLGGQFSTMSNPFQMLYESLEDLGGLAERVEKMFNNIGTFDKNLGQVTISGPDRIRIKAAADAMGMAYEEAIEIINNRARRNEIEKQLKFNTNISDESKDFIKTIAQWNAKTKSFQVRSYNEEKKSFENRNINELSEDDIKKISQEPDDDIKKIVERTFSINKRLERLNTTIEATKAAYLDKYRDGVANIITDTTNILANTKWIAEILLGISAAMIGLNLFKSAKGIGKIAKNSKGIKGAMYSALPRDKVTGKISKTALAKRAAGASIAGAVIGGTLSYLDSSTDVNSLKKEREELIKSKQITPGGIEDEEYKKRIEHAEKNRIAQTIGGAVGTGVGSLLYLVPYVGGVAGTVGSIGIGKLGSNIGSSIVGEYESVDDGAVYKNKVIKANSKDSAIFAKENGPFDKLFGDIIPKIDGIYKHIINGNKMRFLSEISNNNYFSDVLHNKKEIISNIENKSENNKEYISNVNDYKNEYIELTKNESKVNNALNHLLFNNKTKSNILSKSISDYKVNNLNNFLNENNKKSNYEYSDFDSSIENTINKTYKNDIEPLYNKIIEVKPIGGEKESINEHKDKYITQTNNLNNKISINPIEIKINGSLKIDFDGNKVDILENLKNNPILLREITKLLTNEISSSINGGRAIIDKNRFAKI